MLFDYRDTVPLSGIPPVSAEELGAFVRRYIAEGWRLLALFGLPESSDENAPAGLCCVLAQDSSHYLAAMRTAPLQSYASMTPVTPQTHLFEREIFEQWGIRPEGHPWLKPVRRIPDAAEANARTERRARRVMGVSYE